MTRSSWSRDAGEQLAAKPKFHRIIKPGHYTDCPVNRPVRFQSSHKEHNSRRCPLLASTETPDKIKDTMMAGHCWPLLLLLVNAFVESNLLLEGRIDDGLAQTERIASSETEGLIESQEDLERLKMLLRQASNSSGSGNDTVTVTRQGPCQCSGGICGCCSRILYERWKQKACVNITYDPDEFSFTANIMMNDRVLYTRTVSGKSNFYFHCLIKEIGVFWFYIVIV